MDLDFIRIFCLNKKSVTESFPFGDTSLVFKVAGKIFLILAIDSRPLQFNVKCDPEKALQLREEFSSVIPAFHMNKKHWNTIMVDGAVSVKQLKEWIDHSYELVVDSLPKKLREQFK